MSTWILFRDRCGDQWSPWRVLDDPKYDASEKLEVVTASELTRVKEERDLENEARLENLAGWETAQVLTASLTEERDAQRRDADFREAGLHQALRKETDRAEAAEAERDALRSQVEEAKAAVKMVIAETGKEVAVLRAAPAAIRAHDAEIERDRLRSRVEKVRDWAGEQDQADYGEFIGMLNRILSPGSEGE